jgi:signal transduction histidine kinase/predicted ATPase
MLTHNLPSFATHFIGRDSEVTQILSLVNDPACRMLTLTGQGGIGKTRLSIEVAHQISEQHADQFPDGTYFISLASLTSANYITLAVAQALDISFSGTETLEEQLIDYLRDMQLLLVLDNFEHVLEGVSLVSELLAVAQKTKVLATSRERLQLPVEQVFTVHGMTTPEAEQVNRIEDFDALLLFQQVAEKVDYRFKITEDLKPCVIRICQLAEGMPLAIELAAAWVRALSCQIIREELEQSFEILGDTLTHVPERHRSLRIVFEYSWNLLTDEERNIFKGLSVFRGGFTTNAATQITGATVHSISSLVDKSLLRQNSNGRYHIHELLRQFTEEKLAENSDQLTVIHTQHSEYFANFLYQKQDEFIRYNSELPAIGEISVEMDNIRVMWNWATSTQYFDVIDRSSDCLYHYYRIQEAWRESSMMLQTAIASIETASSFDKHQRLYAKLLSMLTIVANFGNLRDLSEEVAHQGLSIAKSLDMPMAVARCLDTIGNLAISAGNYEEALQNLSQAESILADFDETYEVKFVRLRLGYAYYNLGQLDNARKCYRQLIRSGRADKTDGLVAWALDHLGQLENSIGNYSAGQQHYSKALEAFESYGWLMAVFSSSRGLANSYSGLGRLAEARHYYHVALKAYIAHGSQAPILVMLTFGGIANLLALEGDVARAIELATFVEQSAKTPNEMLVYIQSLSNDLEAKIPSVIFQAAKERGTYLNLRSTVYSFIDEFESDLSDDEPPPTSSEQELELLQHVVEGLESGQFLDDNLSEHKQENVRHLLATIDDILEREKAKIMAIFMESASHDLRTPLTIINTNLYLLSMISDPDKRKEKLKSIKEQVNHLQSLIENLLDMARLDGGQDFEKHPIDINQLLIAIRETHLAKLTAERNLDIRIVLTDKPMMILADQEYLEQAVLNIIENAIHYTLDGGTITISTSFQAGTIIIDVSDTGIGIAEEYLPHIFERFFRVDEARTERGRSGLGLAITKKIIEAHNGKIAVNSTLDEGSMFQVILPYTQ